MLPYVVLAFRSFLRTVTGLGKARFVFQYPQNLLSGRTKTGPRILKNIQTDSMYFIHPNFTELLCACSGIRTYSVLVLKAAQHAMSRALDTAAKLAALSGAEELHEVLAKRVKYVGKS